MPLKLKTINLAYAMLFEYEYGYTATESVVWGAKGVTSADNYSLVSYVRSTSHIAMVKADDISSDSVSAATTTWPCSFNMAQAIASTSSCRVKISGSIVIADTNPLNNRMETRSLVANQSCSCTWTQ